MEREGWILNLNTIPYEQAFELQKRLVKLRAEDVIKDTLVLLEHPPVITLTTPKTMKNILVSPGELEKRGISLCTTNRGGDITYHGPGQLVGYPIMNLKEHGKDLHLYIRTVEEMIIRVLADYTVAAQRDPQHPGVWIGNEKIAAIGIAVRSNWITMHGFSLNVNPDLDHYSLIVPCGIPDRGITSLSRTLARSISVKQLRKRVVYHFGDLFNLHLKEITLGDIGCQ